MKKSIVALAVLGSFAGVAAAQSSVTLFGVVDVAARYTKANGQDVYSLASGGNATSRLGVRGVEDLGGGLKAGFWLESRINADAGTTDSAFWARRSTISVWGDFGEVRLGRFKNSTKLAYEDFDPVTATGLGSVENLYSDLGTKAGLGRYDNQVTYVLPANLGGFYGSVDVAAGEGSTFGKSYSGRVGYKANAINVSAAYMESGVDTKYKLLTLGASYDFGVAKPSLIYTTTEFGALKQEVWTAAVTAPLGSGSVWASYSDAADKSTVASTKYKASQFAAGYVYNLSKRTALYTTVSLIDNGEKATFNLNGNVPAVAPAGDGRVGGFDLGVRHNF
ncbi:putative porin [Paucibacter oligotrophus]|uniref:Putative porin n=1 Tax=Roseateles oligotrophus TaxID=1769250 RepID=A0A840LAH6_9BURK|nr:porin [Roseateles oligotrophus]MBB4844751.1 putative porin [Roseateles oligotrophus]